MPQNCRTRLTALSFLLVATVVCGLAARDVVGQQPTKGSLSTIVVLVEFPDLRHKVPREAIHRLVFEEVNSYYQEVSFGKVWITGRITDWITIPNSYRSYVPEKVDKMPPPHTLATDAIRAVDESVNFRDYQYVFVVAPIGGLAHALMVDIQTNDGVRVTRVAVVHESADEWRFYAHEFGHLLGLPDLYNPGLKKGERPDDMDFWDVMSRGAVHFSAWSKIRLGWIEKDQIQDVVRGQIVSVTLEPAERKTDGKLVLRHQITPAGQKALQYYLIEVRQHIGFDRNLPGTGVLVIWADDSAKKDFVKVKDADPSTDSLDALDIGPSKNRIYLDEKNDFAIILLYKRGLAYRVHVTTSGRANTAMQTWSLIEDANSTITKAWQDPRPAGLDATRQMLKKAVDSFDSGNYDQIPGIAKEVKGMVEQATKPKGYFESVFDAQMIIPLIVISGILIGVFLYHRMHRQKAGR